MCHLLHINIMANNVYMAVNLPLKHLYTCKSTTRPTNNSIILKKTV